MKSFSTNDVAKATGGRLCGSDDGALISSVTMDSRLAKEGSLFVAIKGERVDGHDFIKDVFDKGAAAVLCDHVPEGVTGACIVVEDTVKALQELAGWYRSILPVKVVGITGSVGKTSTKEMVASVLSAGFKVLKTQGNYNNEIGLPLTVLSIDEDTEIAVLEMGISDFGEMRVLSRIARPDICVITNIGQSHLENLGTRDGILRAKSEIFEFRNKNGAIFLNGDDDKLITVKDVDGTKPVFYGMGKSNYAHPESIVSLGLSGSEMTIVLGERKFDARITIPGNHMVMNACVSAAIGKNLGMSIEDIKKGLASATTISGRLNLIKNGDGYIIDDCYNAAPLSMKASVDTLCLAKGKKVAILGDMFELGKDTQTMHAEVGAYAASKSIDKYVFVGELGACMYKAAKEKAPDKDMVYFKTLDDCLSALDRLIASDDNVLVKASNGMHFSKIVEKFKS